MTTKIVSILTATLTTLTMVWAQDLYLENARVVDPASQEIRRENLLIADGTIVGAVSEVPAGFTGTTLNLGGKWIIPGLNDLHTHSYGNMGPGNYFEGPGTPVVARRMLYAGATGFLDLFGLEDALVRVRQRQRQGEIPGADIYASLSCLTATAGHCTEYGIPTRVMDSPDDARKQVSELALKQPDVVKIVYSPTGRMPSIDKATLEAAVATANQLGIKTVIHVQSWDGVRDAVEAGASAITHVPAEAQIPDDLAILMTEKGVYSIPTLAVHADIGRFLEDPSVLDHPLAQALAPEALIAAYRTEEVQQHRAHAAENADQRRARILASVKVMAEAGVTVLTGTDSGNWGTIQGYSIHRELVLLVEAGLTPWQALAAATVNAGRFLGQPFGVSAGSVANLVVLEASPIEDIRNTNKISGVIHHGKLVDRAALLNP